MGQEMNKSRETFYTLIISSYCSISSIGSIDSFLTLDTLSSIGFEKSYFPPLLLAIPKGVDDGLDQKGSKYYGEKWGIFMCIVRKKPASFPNRLGMEYERKKASKNDSKYFVLSNWRDEVAIKWQKKNYD